MKKYLFLTFLIILLFIAACSRNGTQREEPMLAITGQIVEIKDGMFLVESKTAELPDGSPDAIWFTTDDIDSLSKGKGQLVSVWTSHIEESYPGQAEAEKIEIQK